MERLDHPDLDQPSGLGDGRIRGPIDRSLDQSTGRTGGGVPDHKQAEHVGHDGSPGPAERRRQKWYGKPE